MVGFSNERARSHLRLVGEEESPAKQGFDGVAPQPHQTSGSPAQPSVNPALAIALSHEAQLFRAVRTRGLHQPFVASATPALPISPPNLTPAPSPKSDDLGERFAALTASGVPSGSIDADRVQAVLERLRAALVDPQPDVGPSSGGLTGRAATQSAPALWVPAALRALSQSDPQSAGRILLAEMCLLHRVNRSARVAVRIKNKGLVVADCAERATRVTRLSTTHIRRDGRLVVRSSSGRLATSVLLGRAGWRSSREGIAQLRALAALPVGTEDLLGAGLVVDPLAFWRLVASALPVAKVDQQWCIEHRAPFPDGGFASIRLSPGRPIVVSVEASLSPDAVVTTTPDGVLAWATGASAPNGGEVTQTGDPQAIDALRAQIAAVEYPGSTSQEFNQVNG